LQGEVVDWIELPNWPIFNIADMAVVGAAIIISILSFKNVAFDKPQEKK
jgi:signal peptidase II